MTCTWANFFRDSTHTYTNDLWASGLKRARVAISVEITRSNFTKKTSLVGGVWGGTGRETAHAHTRREWNFDHKILTHHENYPLYGVCDNSLARLNFFDDG